MAKQTKGSKKTRAKTTKAKVSQAEGHGVVSPDIRPDYFARFRFDLEELLSFLKERSGLPFTDVPMVYRCLDDLGYWSLVRQSTHFQYTAELESSLRAQYELLSIAFSYNPGQILLWGDLNNPSGQRYEVQLVERVAEGDLDLFRIQVLASGATILVSRFELDFWNASGSSLPEDSLGEVINWDRDFFWLKRLRDFKELMVSKKFNFDFMAVGESLRQQQEQILQEIEGYFNLPSGPLEQKNRGLGFLACGQGGSKDSALVVSMALQALAQSFGIKARLWSTEDNNSKDYQVKVSMMGSAPTCPTNNDERFLNEPQFRPIQRPLSEVLSRVLAKGPFGKAESSSVIRGALPQSAQGEEFAVNENH